MAKKTSLTIVQEIFRSRNIYGVLYGLKTLNYEESSKKILQAIKHPIAYKTLYHESSLPKKISSLRVKNFLGFSNNLEGELAWFVKSVVKYSSFINKFIELEKKLEDSILLDDFKSLEILEEINTEICFSYWGIENLFSLCQRKDGDEGNWALLKELNEQTTDYYTLFFNGIYSRKAESEMALLQYQRGIETELNSLSPEDAEYLLFKLGYFFAEDYSEYAYILSIENASSIIDKYITLWDILSELSNSEEHLHLVAKVLKDIENENIVDDRIQRFKEINNIPNEPKFNTDLLELFDVYASGDYNMSIEMSKDLFKKYPHALEIYQIYVESLIESGLGFYKTNVSLMVDEILENLYSVFLRDKNYFTARENLLKLYLTFSRINFFKQLLGLVSIMTGIKSQKDILNNNFYVFSRYSNPLMVLAKKSLFNLFQNSTISERISFKINSSIANNNLEILNDVVIPKVKLQLYDARAKFNKKNYAGAISVLEKIKEDFTLNSYREEEVIYLLFHSYLVEEKFDNSVKLCVDSFFDNKFYVERLRYDVLYTYIIGKDYNISPSVDLPIFFFINSATSYQQYVSLEIYLDSINVVKPSEIFFTDEDFNKQIFILDKICSIEVLNYFYSVFINDDEILEERKEILRKLISADKSKSSIYLDELAIITQREKINNIIQYVNNGKIRLNFSRIKDNRDINLENNFNRFIKFREYSKINDLTILDTQVLIENYLSELNTDSSKLQDASFVLFKSVFFEVLEHFLFSEEHGLDGDISTRIRHGVLENQIRKIFLNTNLIALKNKNGIYEDIFYWNEYGENHNYKEEVIKEFQDILKKFSKSVDDIIDFIVNEQMQVYANRFTKKKKGLFYYNFSEEFLWVIYKKTTESVKDYDEFLNFSYEVIKGQTDIALVAIRDYFRFQVNDVFHKYLDDLDENMKKIFPLQADIFSELFQIINNTKVMIQKELDSISDWFKDSNPIIDSSLDIKTIIETSVESINLIHANNKIHANIDVQSETLLQGFDYYIVIFGILLDNILKHAGVNSSGAIDVDIIASTYEVYIEEAQNELTCLSIIVKNKLNENVNGYDLIAKLEDTKSNWKTSLDKVNVEGGSGFQKIKRILKYDIKAFDNEFDYEYSNSELSIKLNIFMYFQNFEE